MIGAAFSRVRAPVLFGLIGALNTGIDFATFLILVDAGLHPLVANTFSFSLGAANSYVLNAKFTFAVAGRRARSWRTIVRFVLVTFGTLAVSHGVVWTGLVLMLPPGPAKFVSVLATFGVGFVLNKLFVFGAETSKALAAL